jgi:prepilin-type processing-associated H-X9-DG protein
MNNPYSSNKPIADDAPWSSSMSAEYAVAGDMNPGTDDLLKLTTQSSAAQMRHGNSFNHNQDGQNVLFGDGHVEFDQNPLVGVKRDNIYTFEASDQTADDRSASAGIIGSPISAEDSVLLPTAKSIGSVDEKDNLLTYVQVQPVTAAQAAELRKKLRGKYTRNNGNIMHLTVTDTNLREAWGPATIAYDYEIKGTAGDQLRLTLTAPETTPRAARIDFIDNGLRISKCPALAGEWIRDQ